MNRLKDTLFKIYAYSALSEFMLIYPLYAVMFSDRGLDAVQISTLFVLWSAASIAAEVPTGALADKFPRKYLLIIAQIIQAAGFGAWIFWPSFAGFGVGFVLWGIGGAFASGAFEALVYDELESRGKASTYVKVIGKSESISLVAILISTLLAALAVTQGYAFIIMCSITFVLLAAIVAATLPATPPGDDDEDEEESYTATIKTGLLAAVHDPFVAKIMALGAFIGALYGSIEEYAPLLFDENNISLEFIPIADGFTVLTAAIASYMAHKYELLSTKGFMRLLALSGLVLVLATVVQGIGAVIFMGGFMYIVSLLSIIFDGKLQHNIPKKLRATITSVAGFLAEILTIGMFLVFGAVSSFFGFHVALMVLGSSAAAVALAYSIIGPRLLQKRQVSK